MTEGGGHSNDYSFHMYYKFVGRKINGLKLNYNFFYYNYYYFINGHVTT